MNPYKSPFSYAFPMLFPSTNPYDSVSLSTRSQDSQVGGQAAMNATGHPLGTCGIRGNPGESWGPPRFHGVLEPGPWDPGMSDATVVLVTGEFYPFSYLVGDWNHGILNDFPETVGNWDGMSSQLTTCIIFQMGRYTTNQIIINNSKKQ